MASALSSPAFQRFELEAWQSRFETEVDYNLADSGVSPVRLEELISGPEAVAKLLKTELHYPPVGGTPGLRAAIADWHGAAPDDVLVTVGAAEANAITVATLVRPGDHVVVMEPGYRQVWGCATNVGARVDAFPLDPARGWRPDLEALERIVTPQTKLIAITSPNNPVGTVLTGEEMDAIVGIASSAGAWLLADEVYRGLERDSGDAPLAAKSPASAAAGNAANSAPAATASQNGGGDVTVAPSFWGRAGYGRILCVGSTSKAFALSGLRLGWLVAPADTLQAAWRHHEYITISSSALSMDLAELALQPAQRTALLRRNKALMAAGWAVLRDWVDRSGGLVSLVPPQATALAFIRYHVNAPSLEVANAIRTRASVLVAPGEHFGVERHLRLTFRLEPGFLRAALDAMLAVLGELAEEHGRAD